MLAFSIICFLLFFKLLLFWLWLWQLKEYHLGRFIAHFESQKFKKIISSLWRPKFPQAHKENPCHFVCQYSVGGAFAFPGPLPVFYFPLIIIVPLLFQIPSVLWRKIVIEKAKKKREKFRNLLVIGITGSYGKTSTKELIAAILSEKFNVLKTKEHQNSEIGISRCVKRVKFRTSSFCGRNGSLQ